MDASHSLYTVDEQVAASLAGQQPVLINLLEGFIDAGHVTKTLTDTIMDECEHTPLVTFDHDQFHDYRSRRPVITFDTNKFTELVDIEVVLSKVTDPKGQVFLLLAGPEPDTKWEAMMAALLELIHRFEVKMTISAHGIPMAVPHTRPIEMTIHGTNPVRLEGTNSWIDRVEIPASFSAVLEYRLGREERDAQGYAVYVPHYLAQSRFPAAAVAVLTEIETLSGLRLPTEKLEASVTSTMTEISAEMEQSDEVQRIVADLEVQYDAFASRASEPVPSAEEIGAEFERFLRDQSQ